MLTDACGRTIDYLRLSVTDRCDLRCSYCQPQGSADYEPPRQWMRFDEIERLARVFVTLGVSRIRLTGGEPLVLAGIDELAGRLSKLAGLQDLSLSTNGTRLNRYAYRLRSAGVRRLNVSLDTLSHDRFLALTGRDALTDVLAGLESAAAGGFESIKVNMVWLPKLNGDEVEAMIAFCMARGFILRLIENMPMGEAARAHGSHSLQPLIGLLRARFNLVDHLAPGGGPARYLATPDRSFSLGFITPLSQHFCESCNRVRLAVDGTLHLCLGQEDRVDLLSPLRAGATDAELSNLIRSALWRKPVRHDFIEQPRKIVRVMARTGG